MPDIDYIFGNDTLHFFSSEDVFAMYENGVPVKQITRSISRTLGLTLAACSPFVQRSIASRLVPVIAPHTSRNAFLFDDIENPQETAAAVFGAPAKPSPRSWAVGDLVCRRY